MDNWSLRARVSTDGRYVAFQSNATNLVTGDTNNDYDIFLHDRNNSITKRVSVASDGGEADFLSRNTDLSPDGQVVVFHSFATNLIESDTNLKWDIFVNDQLSGRKQQVPIPSMLLLLLQGNQEQ